MSTHKNRRRCFYLTPILLLFSATTFAQAGSSQAADAEARVESILGRMTLQEDEVDLVAATGAALRMVRSRAEAAGLALELRNQLPPDIIGVRGDERRLKQIVLNLVSNAIKFTPANGRVSVTLAAAAERDGITVAVADTGIGIAARDLPRIERHAL